MLDEMQYKDKVVKKLLSTSIIILILLASFAVFFVETVKAGGPSPPYQSGESPTNGCSGVYPVPSLYVVCADNDTGDTMNATWWSNSSSSWMTFGSNTSIANNTNITQTNSNFSSPGTTYWWSVNLTDGSNWANITYSFTTNYPPSQTGEVPTSGATGVNLIPALYVTCTDADDDTMTATWWSNSSGTWTQFATNTNINSGTNITQTNSDFSEYNTTYWWSVNLTDGYNWINNIYYFTTRSQYLPDPPSSFTALASGTNTISLSWTKDSKADTTRIQRKTGSYPTSISDGTNVYYGNGTAKIDSGLSASTTYYYSAWSWNNTGGLWSIISAKDSATTKPSGGGSSPPAPPVQPPLPPSAPTADANGPYFASLIEGVAEVTFDGSSSSGSISSYSWDFGDGETGSGVSPTHRYTALRDYTVKLTVTGPGGSSSDETMAYIREVQNLPPDLPEVSGPQKGSKNIDYEYTAVSTDEDNDKLQYIFDWDDGTNSTSDFVANGTSVTQMHNWSTWGVYTISVTAFDNKTLSGSTDLVVLIDVIWVKDIGYLIDDDSDAIYDLFHSNVTGRETDVDILPNGSYLINSDTDSEWDYIYEAETSSLSTVAIEIDTGGEEQPALPWYIIVGAVIIAIILIIGFLFKIGYLYIEIEEDLEQTKGESVKKVKEKPGKKNRKNKAKT